VSTARKVFLFPHQRHFRESGWRHPKQGTLSMLSHDKLFHTLWIKTIESNILQGLYYSIKIVIKRRYPIMGIVSGDFCRDGVLGIDIPRQEENDPLVQYNH